MKTVEQVNTLIDSFTNLLWDKGNGSFQDYVSFILSTCLFKRIVDLQQEYNEKEKKNFLKAKEDCKEQLFFKDINNKSFNFYDSDKIEEEKIQQSVQLITWEDIVTFKDNPN